MKQTCPGCKSIIELDETKYKPGEIVKKNCPLCDTEISFSIPEPKAAEPQTVEKVVVKEVEDTKSKKKIQELENTVNKLLKDKQQEESKRKQPEKKEEEQGESEHNRKISGVIVFLLIIAACGGGYFYYDNIYLPEKIDREAPRYYTFANSVILRSSQSSGADFNKVGSLPYGTELITYEYGKDWSKVKVNAPNGAGERLEGYIASPFILNKHDFFLLNSIFGDVDSKETIATTKCRLALLNYFKEKQYIGSLTAEMLSEAGISIIPNTTNQWQVFSRSARLKPNTVLYKRLINKDSKYTDFAMLIKNISTNERKLLYFYFDDDETPHLASEQDAPQNGFIRDASIYTDYQGNSYLHVDYSE